MLRLGPVEGEGPRVKAHADAAAAIEGVSRIHISLADDASVDAVLEPLADRIPKSTWIVDHTTTSASGTAERVKRWTERGITYQHAPVFMGPQNALESTGIMLASGDRAQFDALEPALAKMTGQLIYLGPQPERAAGMKLLGNLFLMAVTTGLADTLTLAKALGIPHSDVESLFTWFNPGTTIGARLKRMTGGDYSRPSWELAMARKCLENWKKLRA